MQFDSFSQSEKRNVLNETLDNPLEALKSAEEQPIAEFLASGSYSKPTVRIFMFCLGKLYQHLYLSSLSCRSRWYIFFFPVSTTFSLIFTVKLAKITKTEKKHQNHATSASGGASSAGSASSTSPQDTINSTSYPLTLPTDADRRSSAVHSATVVDTMQLRRWFRLFASVAVAWQLRGARISLGAQMFFDFELTTCFAAAKRRFMVQMGLGAHFSWQIGARALSGAQHQFQSRPLLHRLWWTPKRDFDLW